jgi:hypothetical protein
VPIVSRVAVLVPLPTIRSPVVKAFRPVPPLVIARVPVTPVESGKPVALVSVTDAGTPSVGVTSVGEVERTTDPDPVELVTPVPPLATTNVPANVIVPDDVIGPPLVVRPVVPPLTSTLLTPPPPPPETAAQTPSPRQ